MDHSLAPLHRIVFPSSYDYEELDAAFTELEEFFGAIARNTPHQPVGVIVDTTLVTKSTAKNRQRIALASERMSSVLEAQAIGQAFVVSRPVTRGALTAVMWIKNPPWPVKVFARVGPAEEWLRGKFQEAGVVVPRAPTREVG